LHEAVIGQQGTFGGSIKIDDDPRMTSSLGGSVLDSNCQNTFAWQRNISTQEFEPVTVSGYLWQQDSMLKGCVHSALP
jgi:hypothetical protein